MSGGAAAMTVKRNGKYRTAIILAIAAVLTAVGAVLFERRDIG